MLKLRAYVSDVSSILLTYDRIEIGRAATQADAAGQTGTFASLGNVITLQAGVETYTYTDLTGAVGQWYVSRYTKNGGGPTPSEWSVPFQGAAMGYLTAAEFRDYDLGYLVNNDGSAMTDDQLDRHISTASHLIDGELNGLSFGLTQSVERHKWRQHSRRIYPYQRPIVSADALVIYVGANQVATMQVSELFVNVQSNYVEISDLASTTYSLFPAIAELGLYEPVAELTYTHGYAVIPQDVKDATAITVAEVLAERALINEGIGAGVSQFRIGDYMVSRRAPGLGSGGATQPPGLAVPAAAKSLISHYNVISLR